jgi:hypothetical protein
VSDHEPDSETADGQHRDEQQLGDTELICEPPGVWIDDEEPGAREGRDQHLREVADKAVRPIREHHLPDRQLFMRSDRPFVVRPGGTSTEALVTRLHLAGATRRRESQHARRSGAPPPLRRALKAQSLGHRVTQLTEGRVGMVAGRLQVAGGVGDDLQVGLQLGFGAARPHNDARVVETQDDDVGGG